MLIARLDALVSTCKGQYNACEKQELAQAVRTRYDAESRGQKSEQSGNSHAGHRPGNPADAESPEEATACHHDEKTRDHPMRKRRGAPNLGKRQHEHIIYYPVRVHRHGLKVYRVGIVSLEE